jgi:replicative DNA helicase
MNPERTLPSNLEAERAVLGAILLNSTLLQEAAGIVHAKDFYRSSNSTVFKHMLKLAAMDRAIDYLTLKDALASGGDLDEVGGAAYIAALTDGVPRSTSVAHYAGIVRDKANLRELIFAANRMMHRAYDEEEEAAEILARAERDIIGLADRTVTKGFESARTIAQRVFDAIEKASERKAGVSGIPSGLKDLDEVTLGFQPGTLVTIGARPGIGKSSLLSNIVQHAASLGQVAGLFSLEMGKVEVVLRQVSAAARIDSHRMKGGWLGERDWGRLNQAIGTIAESPMFVDDTAAINAFEVRSRARKLKAEHGLNILAIDYVQLMSPVDKSGNRALDLSSITAALKVLAMDLQIPVLIASQLSRDNVKDSRRPRLSDLRESGSIEQDSDIVMLLHRDEDKPELPTELIVGKHRGGPIGTIKVSWLPEFTKYEDYNPSEAPIDQRLPMSER